MARNTNKKHFSLKDELFNRQKVRYLAGLFALSDADFDAAGFEEAVMERLVSLELKARIVWIADVLESYVNPDFTVACQQILAALPAPLDPALSDDDFGDFIFAPLGVFVVRNGLDSQYQALSMHVLKELTQRFSMEDSIRYFIDAYPEEVMCELEQWATDDNYHVRRLASEGTRPLLPWSARLQIPVDRPLAILDILYTDPTRYVVRSVANHLNDISKSDPDIVLQVLTRWHQQNAQDHKQSGDELSWLTSHALRTLIKQGHPGALQLLGYSLEPDVTVSDLCLDQSVLHGGGILSFSCEIEACVDEKLMIDYVVCFAKADGRMSEKIFKLKRCFVKKGDIVLIAKKHHFRADATTYRLYSGAHSLGLQINGQRYPQENFTLSL